MLKNQLWITKHFFQYIKKEKCSFELKQYFTIIIIIIIIKYDQINAALVALLLQIFKVRRPDSYSMEKVKLYMQCNSCAVTNQ